MKKIISVLLILMMLLALAACGANHEEVIETQPSAVTSTEATLSPREQFQQQKEAMEELLNNSGSGEEAEAVQPVVARSFSAISGTANFALNTPSITSRDSSPQFAGRLGSFLPICLALTGFLIKVYFTLSSSLEHFCAWNAASPLG